MNKTQKQMLAAINRIDATWATSDDITDTPETDHSGGNTDNDADFHQEEE